jgi:hypothetical protein
MRKRKETRSTMAEGLDDDAPIAKKCRKSKAQSTEHADRDHPTPKPRFMVFISAG